MSRFVTIALVLATAGLAIAAKQALPMFASDPGGPAAEMAILPDDMTLTTGPVPPPLAENYI
jgi:hypothetical protein